MSESPGNVIFCRKKGACGSREDLTEPDTCPKQNRSAIFVEKRPLRQPGRPHRAQYMWKVTGTQFLQKKKRLRQPEDPTEPNTCQTTPGTQFWPKEKRLRQPGRPQQAYKHLVSCYKRKQHVHMISASFEIIGCKTQNKWVGMPTHY